MNDVQHYSNLLLQYATEAGMKILAAIALWILGRWLIRIADKLLRGVLDRQHFDPMLTRYMLSFMNIALNIVLVVVILGYFGVQTTTFAALVAGAGVAIGAAWSGLLGNFAAGAFLLVLKPFKVGDFVKAGDVTGTVKEVGLFVTSIVTLDNVLTFVGNGKILGNNIENYSTNDYRRVELKCQLSSDADHVAAMELLRKQVQAIPNVLTDPAPVIEILEFNSVGPVLTVFPFCNNAHYWQVYFDTNRTIRETLTQAGFAYALPKQVWVGKAA
ncbi:MAG: mechanosensitive ion channel family protein [Thiomonas arsenitoxydans]|nr:mechanosensitive ion channel family protein [Thiomonas arsenitoxydans]